jgi:hypothetical protein
VIKKELSKAKRKRCVAPFVRFMCTSNCDTTQSTSTNGSRLCNAVVPTSGYMSSCNPIFSLGNFVAQFRSTYFPSTWHSIARSSSQRTIVVQGASARAFSVHHSITGIYVTLHFTSSHSILVVINTGNLHPIFPLPDAHLLPIPGVATLVPPSHVPLTCHGRVSGECGGTRLLYFDRSPSCPPSLPSSGLIPSCI